MTATDRTVSPAGARRERPVLCPRCTMRTTINHGAVCDPCLDGDLRPCARCGRPTTDELCSECAAADEMPEPAEDWFRGDR